MGTSLSFMRRLTSIAVSTISIFLIFSVPLFVTGGWPLIKEMNGLLFPFKRGLQHASSAHSSWALYGVMDKVLTRLGIIVRVPDAFIRAGPVGSFCPFHWLPNPFSLACTFLATDIPEGKAEMISDGPLVDGLLKTSFVS